MALTTRGPRLQDPLTAHPSSSDPLHPLRRQVGELVRVQLHEDPVDASLGVHLTGHDQIGEPPGWDRRGPSAPLTRTTSDTRSISTARPARLLKNRATRCEPTTRRRAALRCGPSSLMPATSGPTAPAPSHVTGAHRHHEPHGSGSPPHHPERSNLRRIRFNRRDWCPPTSGAAGPRARGRPRTQYRSVDREG